MGRVWFFPSVICVLPPTFEALPPPLSRRWSGRSRRRWWPRLLDRAESGNGHPTCFGESRSDAACSAHRAAHRPPPPRHRIARGGRRGDRGTAPAPRGRDHRRRHRPSGPDGDAGRLPRAASARGADLRDPGKLGALGEDRSPAPRIHLPLPWGAPAREPERPTGARRTESPGDRSRRRDRGTSADPDRPCWRCARRQPSATGPLSGVSRADGAGCGTPRDGE